MLLLQVSARLQGRFDSDEESDASSVCSAGSHGTSPRIPEVTFVV